MSILSLQEQPQSRLAVRRETSAALIRITETLCTIVTAWEALSTEPWSIAGIQSFATLTRRNALELPSFGCGALEQALVELVLALDALVLSNEVTRQQIERVDHVMALIRAVTLQRILASELGAIALPGEAPVIYHEVCPRCSGVVACGLLR